MDESIEENQKAVRYIEDTAQKLLTERVTNGSTTIQTEIANLKKQLAQHLKLPEQTGEEASPLYQATIMFDGSGLDETTGLRTKKFTDDTAAVIVEADELTADKAHKVYIRNTSANRSNFFYVAYNASAAAAQYPQKVNVFKNNYEGASFSYDGTTAPVTIDLMSIVHHSSLDLSSGVSIFAVLSVTTGGESDEQVIFDKGTSYGMRIRNNKLMFYNGTTPSNGNGADFSLVPSNELCLCEVISNDGIYVNGSKVFSLSGINPAANNTTNANKPILAFPVTRVTVPNNTGPTTAENFPSIL